ncbi:2-oxo-4-hydroxy-4-carboxy-5-ureidoimidazoline decarboxylase-like [Oratosquilla oratoria]|uniref:2-oxo-4-hydroxy-4-carboxy-5-ureidoimidazoline decarboxylase-like n=1 Tax=Oratosquilla oratoria TaxID=337810 RepID=UPI003F76B56F
MAKLTIEEVNRMDYEAFVQTFGNVVEHGTIISAAIWKFRPFDNVKHLHDTICDFIALLPTSGKEGILRCHPDLAGRLAQMNKLTEESTTEQKSAGLDQLSKEELDFLNAANSKYRSKFNFPFVICARENKKTAIFEGLRSRVSNSPEIELQRGIEEVKKICYYRLLDLIQMGVDPKL